MKFPKYTRSEPVSVKITAKKVMMTIALAAFITACGATAHTLNTIATEQDQQNQITHHWLSVQPLPTFSGKSQIRQNVIELQHAQVVGAETTSFECGGLDGCDPTHPPIKSCPSVGSPIPVDTQLSNPGQPEADSAPPLNNGGGNLTIGNMEPSGIYPGHGLGTYVLCIRPGGAVEPSYFEGLVQVEFGPAQWIKDQGIVDTGPPSFQFTH